jgi:hypothetical protein
LCGLNRLPEPTPHSFEVEVPRSWLRRHSRGLWAGLEDVPPERFKRLIGFEQLAASPVLEDWKPFALAAG